MFDFTVCAKRDTWLLQDDRAGELGAYSTRDEALAAAGEWMRLIEQPWPVWSATPTANGTRSSSRPRRCTDVTARYALLSRNSLNSVSLLQIHGGSMSR